MSSSAQPSGRWNSARARAASARTVGCTAPAGVAAAADEPPPPSPSDGVPPGALWPLPGWPPQPDVRPDGSASFTTLARVPSRSLSRIAPGGSRSAKPSRSKLSKPPDAELFSPSRSSVRASGWNGPRGVSPDVDGGPVTETGGVVLAGGCNIPDSVGLLTDLFENIFLFLPQVTVMIEFRAGLIISFASVREPMSGRRAGGRARALLLLVALAAASSSTPSAIEQRARPPAAAAAAPCCQACEGAAAAPAQYSARCQLDKLEGWALPGNPSARCVVTLVQPTPLVASFVGHPSNHYKWVSRLGRSDVLAASLAEERAPSHSAPLARFGAAFVRGPGPSVGAAALRRARSDRPPRPMPLASGGAATAARAPEAVGGAPAFAGSPASPVRTTADAPALTAGAREAAAAGAVEASTRDGSSSDFYVYYRFTDLVCFKDRDVVARVRVSPTADGGVHTDVRSVESAYRAEGGAQTIRMPYMHIEYRVRRKPCVAAAACECADTAERPAAPPRAAADCTAIECKLAANFGGGVPNWMAAWAVARAETSFTALDSLCTQQRALRPPVGAREQLLAHAARVLDAARELAAEATSAHARLAAQFGVAPAVAPAFAAGRRHGRQPSAPPPPPRTLWQRATLGAPSPAQRPAAPQPQPRGGGGRYYNPAGASDPRADYT